MKNDPVVNLSNFHTAPRRPSILLGDLRIFEPRNGKVLICVEHGLSAGEGGEFNAHELAQIFEDFYAQNF